MTSANLIENSVVKPATAQTAAKNSTNDPEKPFKTEIVWRNVAIFAVLHILALQPFINHWHRGTYLFREYLIDLGHGNFCNFLFLVEL